MMDPSYTESIDQRANKQDSRGDINHISITL